MLNQWSIGMLTIAALSASALASVSTYTSDVSLIADVTNHADFNGMVNEQSLTNYQEDGIQVSASRDYFSWNAPGFDGSEMFYANTGTFELIDITLVDGGYFGDIDLQISSGWSPISMGTMYLWIQIYDAGGLVGEFDLDATTGDYVGLDSDNLDGLIGGGFDQILIGSYASAEIRDSHDANARNAIAIDNINIGTTVPAPGTLVVAGLGLIGLRRRRGC